MSNCLIMSYSNIQRHGSLLTFWRFTNRIIIIIIIIIMMLELKISEVDEMGTEVMGTVDLLFYYKGSLKKL